MEKYYFTYDDIHRTVVDIAGRVAASGYTPDLIIAIGSGGFIPARILRTFLHKPILAVGIAYYDSNDKPTELPRKVQWIEDAKRKLEGKRILLVDEVDDTRVTLEYCLNELLNCAPAEIAVAVLHNKIKDKKGKLPAAVRRYWAGRDIEDKWVAYPWDAEDIEAQDRTAAAFGGRPGTVPDN